jgi:hypothetical protein
LNTATRPVTMHAGHIPDHPMRSAKKSRLAFGNGARQGRLSVTVLATETVAVTALKTESGRVEHKRGRIGSCRGQASSSTSPGTLTRLLVFTLFIQPSIVAPAEAHLALSGAALGGGSYAKYQRRRPKSLDTSMSIAELNVACAGPARHHPLASHSPGPSHHQESESSQPVQNVHYYARIAQVYRRNFVEMTNLPMGSLMCFA